MESKNNVDEVENDIIREVLKYVGIFNSIEIHIISDISTIGTGLGGSSALTIGLLTALYCKLGMEKTQEAIAEDACYIEIQRLKKCIGKQDQYACALGGLNLLQFFPDNRVTYEPIKCMSLRNNMFLYPYHIQERVKAEVLLQEQHKNISDNLQTLNKIKNLNYEMIRYLRNKKLRRIADCINKYWSLKKTLSPLITSSNLEALIKEFVNKGFGVKLCGAGQSGFLLLFSPSGTSVSGAINISVAEKGTSIIFEN